MTKPDPITEEQLKQIEEEIKGRHDPTLEDKWILALCAELREIWEKIKKLKEGERILQDGILSKDSTYRIIVSGKIGVKEIERLVRKLKLDKEILSEIQ